MFILRLHLALSPEIRYTNHPGHFDLQSFLLPEFDMHLLKSTTYSSAKTYLSFQTVKLALPMWLHYCPVLYVFHHWWKLASIDFRHFSMATRFLSRGETCGHL